MPVDLPWGWRVSQVEAPMKTAGKVRGLFNLERKSPLNLRMEAICLGKMLFPTALSEHKRLSPLPLQKWGWARGPAPKPGFGPGCRQVGL